MWHPSEQAKIRSIFQGDEYMVEPDFECVGGIAYDSLPPFQKNAFILAGAATTSSSRRPVLIVCDDKTRTLATIVQQELLSTGYSAMIQALQDPFTEPRDVVALVDVELPFFANMDSDTLQSLQKLLHHIQETRSRLLWVTRSCQLHCTDPEFAQAIGAVRTIRAELGIDAMTCELDEVDDTSVSLLLKLIHRCHTRPMSGTNPRDYEFAISGGQVHIGRLLPTPVHEEVRELAATQPGDERSPVCLQIGTYGRVDSLFWETAKNKAEGLQPDEVEVTVQSVGLNFKDVLITLGIIDLSNDDLGLEAAGIVHRIGSSVQHLVPGDPVFLLGPGTFRSTIITKSVLCARIPTILSLQEAASLPMAFSTAIYSLINVGNLKPGQSVLIHSATGGVGIAAIQVCKMIGADIYATVGNDEKVEFLNSSFGIPRNRIFSSRDSTFLEGIKKATNGRGVDILLNSLSGDLFHDSCECVAERGKLVNIAKRDHIDHGHMPLGRLKTNTTYTYVDMAHLLRDDPMIGKQLLDTILRYYTRGYITPPPLETFAAPNVKEAFRKMQGGQHIGKLVVSINHDSGLLQPSARPLRMTFDSDASYLLVGGLGGLGRAVSQWMADHGARHLIFMSRNVPHDLPFFAELESQNCSVTAVKGDVSNIQDVQAAIAAAPTRLKGVFNMSMVLQDQSITKMTLEEWKTVINPKVQGTWNLHRATSDLTLDFFVLFGSIMGTLGMPGQSKYAAANTFMDSFVQYRHASGLAASVVDVGAVQGIGYIADNPHVLERSKWLHYAILQETELFDVLTVAIASGDPKNAPPSKLEMNTNISHLITGFRGLPQTTGLASRSDLLIDSRLKAYLTLVDQGIVEEERTATSKLGMFLSTLSTNPSVLDDPSTNEFLGRQISLYIFDLLMKPVEDESEIDLTRSLVELGLDSLATVELRGWLKSVVGVDISVFEIRAMRDLAALGEQAAQELRKKPSS